MYFGFDLIGYFRQARGTGTANNAQRRSCDLARVVTTCKFLNDPFTVKAMRDTVAGIESVL